MTTITCDECGRRTQVNSAVYRRVPHYSEAHWVVLVRMCMPCATRAGWDPEIVNPFFCSARQFEAWLQLPAS